MQKKNMPKKKINSKQLIKYFRNAKNTLYKFTIGFVYKMKENLFVEIVRSN